MEEYHEFENPEFMEVVRQFTGELADREDHAMLNGIAYGIIEELGITRLEKEYRLRADSGQVVFCVYESDDEMCEEGEYACLLISSNTDDMVSENDKSTLLHIEFDPNNAVVNYLPEDSENVGSIYNDVIAILMDINGNQSLSTEEKALFLNIIRFGELDDPDDYWNIQLYDNSRSMHFADVIRRTVGNSVEIATEETSLNISDGDNLETEVYVRRYIGNIPEDDETHIAHLEIIQNNNFLNESRAYIIYADDESEYSEDQVFAANNDNSNKDEDELLLEDEFQDFLVDIGLRSLSKHVCDSMIKEMRDFALVHLNAEPPNYN